ncbi:helicase-related protein [Candidatus Poriferisocius sp.]|uniref:helicase-related protein n=1 Tax=Candidatus Poriferisocius sp. TaxID=3101276 RepID=UPI003B026B59
MSGLDPDGPAEIERVELEAPGLVTQDGDEPLRIVYKTSSGRFGEKVLFHAHDLGIVEDEGWTFDSDPQQFLLAAEALRIQRAHLFDPFQATRASDIEPLPHQVDAVYNHMLPRQPLRFLLADDPGAGKTIMAGLLMKELMLRGDLDRCLVVVPGSLSLQWQDELLYKFGLEFELFDRNMVDRNPAADPLGRHPLLIARMDMLARNEALQDLLDNSEWDLLVVDEAHKMSAKAVGRDAKKTKRYRLGERLGPSTRNFLLMTATPHNGYEGDFQLFMALLDSDRFAGEWQRGNHNSNRPDDLMRRMIKEDMKRLDGTPLFPERRADSAKYNLTETEMQLYEAVTQYVSKGMNRAERLQAKKDGRHYNAVGFALTLLQRRLASSPLAVLRSLGRRRERLTGRLKQVSASTELLDEGPNEGLSSYGMDDMGPDLDDFMEFVDEELDSSQRERLEGEVFLDEASFAQTVEELRFEIDELKDLEQQAREVYESGIDRKWEQLALMLQEDEAMRDLKSHQLKKLIVFTEHRDTLDCLVDKLSLLLEKQGEVVRIHGGIPMEERRQIQDQFTHDPNVVVLVATDAAGEGINLQCAHLMVNYDLPWNPNRIEQRFGRIHRIGQTEVCRMWNMVALGTREGDVFDRLFDKLENQRKDLGGKVFDVLGEAFANTPLRDLIIRAIKVENPQLEQNLLATEIDDAVITQTKEIIKRQSLLHNSALDEAACEELRDDMDRAAGYRLQPSYIRRFFLRAFKDLDGDVVKCEGQRFKVNRVPPSIVKRSQYGHGQVQKRYERICFDRQEVTEPGKPPAALLAPGHPLLDAVIGGVNDRYGSLLQKGTVLIDPDDHGTEPRLLVFLEHEIRDATITPAGQPRVVSRRFEYVEVARGGGPADAGRHPYLDCRAPEPEEQELLAELVRRETSEAWLTQRALDAAKRYALENNAHQHLDEIKGQVEEQVDHIWNAVLDRQFEEMTYQGKQKEKFLRKGLHGQAEQAKRRGEEAKERIQRRNRELERQKHLSLGPLGELGIALVVPAGLVTQLRGETPTDHAKDTQRVERLAIDAVLEAERSMGRTPREMPHNNKGYDIETRVGNDPLLFIEVKGRVAGAKHFGITASEVLFALNTAEQHILALVEVCEDDTTTVRYLHDPFTERLAEPGFGEHRRELRWKDYWELAGAPA